MKKIHKTLSCPYCTLGRIPITLTPQEKNTYRINFPSHMFCISCHNRVNTSTQIKLTTLNDRGLKSIEKELIKIDRENNEVKPFPPHDGERAFTPQHHPRWFRSGISVNGYECTNCENMIILNTINHEKTKEFICPKCEHENKVIAKNIISL